MRVLFVNENIGGHATMHAGVAAGLKGIASVEATFVDVPPPGPLRRVVAAPVPGLASLDLDLHPLRDQLTKSAYVRRQVAGAVAGYDVVHVYTQNAGLLLTSARLNC